MNRIPVSQRTGIAAILIWGPGDVTNLRGIDRYYDGYGDMEERSGHAPYVLNSGENCLIISDDGTTTVCAESHLRAALGALEERRVDATNPREYDF